MILAALALALLAPPAAFDAPAEDAARDPGRARNEQAIELVLDAIRVVETGGEPNAGRDATGDGGRSIGPYQIQRAYWIDSGVAGRWEDCRDAEYARRVVKAYWQRYCPRALAEADLEVLARVHNGGLSGHRKTSTLGYWRKVELELAQMQSRAVARVESARARGARRPVATVR